MADAERDKLDRWLESEAVHGELNSWKTKDGTAMYEARVWKDGRVLRFIAADRHEAIAALKAAY